MIFFLALGLILMLAIPGLSIAFIPAVAVMGLPFLLFRRGKTNTKTGAPEPSLEKLIWLCIKRQYPDAIQWEWANGTQKDKFLSEGSADIIITNWDYSVKQFVLSQSDGHFWIDEKVEGFSGVKIISFGTIPTDIDTNPTDPAPDPNPDHTPDPTPDPKPDHKPDPVDNDPIPEDNKPAPAPRLHHGKPKPMPVDYSALAFEWVTAHVSDISEQLSIALDAGEEACLLDASFLPKQEAWNAVAEELRIACDLDAEVKEIGIVIAQKQEALAS